MRKTRIEDSSSAVYEDEAAEPEKVVFLMD